MEAEPPPQRTVADVVVETMVAWGVSHVFGMVGHSNLGLADAMRRQEEAGTLTLTARADPDAPEPLVVVEIELGGAA